MNSCLNAQRDPDLARVSVVLHAVARLFGVGVWNPAFFYLFPSDQYGVVYGMNTMSMLPTTWLMIPLYNYVQTYVYLPNLTLQAAIQPRYGFRNNQLRNRHFL